MPDPVPYTEPAPPASTFTFQTVWHVMLEKAWLVATCFILAVFLTGVYLKRTPRIYASTVVLQIEQMEQRVVKIENVQQEDLRWPDILNTIVQTMISRSVLERVVETNNLVNDPRFTDPATGVQPTRDQLVGMLSQIVSARLRRNTRLIDLTVSHTIPEFTAQIANSVVREYIRMSVEQQATSTMVANDFLMEEAQRLKKKLQESENALQAYKEKTQSVSLEERQNVVVQRLKEINAKVTEAKSLRLKLESELAQADKVGTNWEGLLTLPSVASDSSVSSIQLTLSKLEADFANLKQRYKEKHPRYIQASSEIAEWRKSLQEAVLKVPQTLRLAYENARSSEQALAKAQTEAETAALDLNKQEIQYNVLARDVQSDRMLFENVLQRQKETTLAKNLEPNKLRIVQTAVVPKTPIKPEVKKTLILGLVGGLAAGIMLALFLNSLDTSFRTVDQVETYLGLPVLGVVPQVKHLHPDKSQVIVAEDAKSPGAESFRSLRTSLSMLGREEQRRVFLFTSALPAEGKTFCSMNYAASLAQGGLRTLLIDADLRRPSVEKFLTGKRHGKPGVTDYLTGKAKLEETIQTTSVENFCFVSAGTTAPNPAELLVQSSLDALIDEALHQFDRVVLDSAPIHAVSDTLLILNRVQTLCLVARACKTPRKSILRAMQLLQNADAPLAGVVLNRLPRRRGLDYYYDYYYDYSYRGKYAEKGVYGEA